MKTIARTLFVSIAIAFTTSAAPALLVETTITEHESDGTSKVLLAPRLTVTSGERATIQVSDLKHTLEYAVTPSLKDDGTVEVRAVLTRLDGDKADILAAPRITSNLGQVAEIRIGQLAFTTKTTVAK